MRIPYVERNENDIESAFTLLKEAMAESDDGAIEVNFGRLDLANGKGICELIRLNEYAESIHKKLKFRVPKDVRDLFHFTGMDSFINLI